MYNHLFQNWALKTRRRKETHTNDRANCKLSFGLSCPSQTWFPIYFFPIKCFASSDSSINLAIHSKQAENKTEQNNKRTNKTEGLTKLRFLAACVN